MSRQQQVRVPLRLIVSGTYADSALAVYMKVASLSARREGCTAGVAYLAEILGTSPASVERGLAQLTRPAPCDDVVEITTVRRTLPGGRGTTAVRRVRQPQSRERFVWMPSRAADSLNARQLRAYAAISYAVATRTPITYAELGQVLRHRTGARAGQALDPRSVRRIIQGLAALGWITIDPRGGGRGRHAYTVHEQPSQQTLAPDTADGSGADLDDGSLASKEDLPTDSPDDATAGGAIRRRRDTGSRGVENRGAAARRAYAGPGLSLAPRIWEVLAPVRPLLPGLSEYVVRQLARAIATQLDQGIEPERIRARLESRYATSETVRDSGRWLLGAAVARHGCGLAACESGRIWRTGDRCQVCADLRTGRQNLEALPPDGGRHRPHPAGHRYQPDRRGACARCDLPAANSRHMETR
jgi:hypothetical protein